MRRSLRAMALLPALLAVTTGACGGSTPSAATKSAAGRITVLAASSLTEALNDDKTRLAASHSPIVPTFSFEGSQQIVAQVLAGAPADAVATADEASMQKLVAAKTVDAPRILARNRLEIAVRPGNPSHIAGLADLARPGLRVVLADPSVPAGNYSRQALRRAGVSVDPVSQPLDVKATLQLVETGEADAAIVYVTDLVAAGQRVTGVRIPDDQNVVATYLAAVVRTSPHQTPARAFIAQLLSRPGRDTLTARGFQSP
jgi:molybdate transport system substrate-binding protein